MVNFNDLIDINRLKTFLNEIKSKFAAATHTHTKSDITDFPSSLKNPSSLTLTKNGTSYNYDGSSGAAIGAIYTPTTAGTAGYVPVSQGSGAPLWKMPDNYAVCSTAAGTVAKTAAISNFKLVTGVMVTIKFTYAHTATTAATLNVNSTGAKTIYYYHGNQATKDYAWEAGETVVFQYDGSYWRAVASDRLTKLLNAMVAPCSTIVVAASNSRHKDAADYVCTGSADQTVIANAISALPSGGGKIILLEGTYNLSSYININKENVTIEGMGYATYIHQTSEVHPAIYIMSKNCEISNLYVCADAGGTQATAITVSANDCHIHDIKAEGDTYAISVEGVSGKVYTNIRIHNIHAISGMNGCILLYYAKHCFVSECTCEGNFTKFTHTYGVYMHNTQYCLINDNLIINCHNGVSVQTGTSYNNINDNIIYRTDTYGSSQYSIEVASGATYNNIANNQIPGKNYTNNGGTTNTFANNKYS